MVATQLLTDFYTKWLKWCGLTYRCACCS